MKRIFTNELMECNKMANGWTDERRAKQAALIRTWKPWEKSTGAKTPEGKAKSSKNAFRLTMRKHLLLVRWIPSNRKTYGQVNLTPRVMNLCKKRQVWVLILLNLLTSDTSALHCIYARKGN
jgi:hypothetical protein